jgi:hypothetical protein
VEKGLLETPAVARAAQATPEAVVVVARLERHKLTPIADVTEVVVVRVVVALVVVITMLAIQITHL